LEFRLEGVFDEILKDRSITKENREQFEKQVKIYHEWHDKYPLATHVGMSVNKDGKTFSDQEVIAAHQELVDLLDRLKKLKKEFLSKEGDFQLNKEAFKGIKNSLIKLMVVSGLAALESDIEYLDTMLKRKPPNNFGEKLVEIMTHALMAVNRYFAHLRFDWKVTDIKLKEAKEASRLIDEREENGGFSNPPDDSLKPGGRRRWNP
jgi:hypothetical protein